MVLSSKLKCLVFFEITFSRPMLQCQSIYIDRMSFSFATQSKPETFCNYMLECYQKETSCQNFIKKCCLAFDE